MKHLWILFLTSTIQIFSSENDTLIKRRESVSGLERCCAYGEYTFEYRSDDDYNKNSCTRPLKKIVDYAFCENRDSCCIRNGIDPKSCEADCTTFGITCGMLGVTGKSMSVCIFTDPQNMGRSACSRCACDFGWFPSCSRNFNCGDGTNPPLDSTGCGQCMTWSSSCILISSCLLNICVLTKAFLKEKGQNERDDY